MRIAKLPLFFPFLIFPCASTAAAELKVISDRTESHLKPIFEQFEKNTGNKVSAVFMDQGLLNRLTERPTEADLIITKDAEILALAQEKKLLKPFISKAIEADIPNAFRATDNTFFVDAFRARVIFHSKDRVKPELLSTYEDLSNPKWKGKVCIRSGYHEYNLSLFGQMLLTYGKEKARALIKGIHDNLAREPKGNDREQAKGIFESKCDLALMNSYYHPIMLSNPEQKSWGEATAVFFPDQKAAGAFIMRSAVGLTKAARQEKAAVELMEFMASQAGQDIMTKVTFQYPTNPKAESQGPLKAAETKFNFVPLKDIIAVREEVVKLLDEVGFDKP